MIDFSRCRPSGQGSLCVRPPLGEGVWGRWMGAPLRCVAIEVMAEACVFLEHVCQLRRWQCCGCSGEHISRPRSGTVRKIGSPAPPVKPSGRIFMCVDLSLGEGVWVRWLGATLQCVAIEVIVECSKFAYFLNTYPNCAEGSVVAAVGNIFRVLTRAL